MCTILWIVFSVIEAYHSNKPIILFDQGNGFLGTISEQFIFVEYQNILKVVGEIKKLYETRPLITHDKNLFYLSDIYAEKILGLTK